MTPPPDIAVLEAEGLLCPLPQRSLPEAHASVRIPHQAGWLRKLLAFSGPGYMVSVGYMDPGNWATDIGGGSAFGMTLLSVILISNLIAVLLQALSARLGIATGRDLAQMCRETYSRRTGFVLWIACETAIIACDIAEVIGTAIAFKLLFGLPLIAGAAVTVLDTVLLLYLMKRGFRFLEAFVVALLVVVSLCFGAQMLFSRPDVGEILNGFIPSVQIATNPALLYLAIGILGATVMPHNLYLHSSIVQTRAFARTPEGRKDAVRWATLDSTLALTLALFVNAAILILAASAFHRNGLTDVTSIEEAHTLLSPLLGAGLASLLLGVALLASGLNSTVTATLAGQIVMEGFLNLRLKPWMRRLITRLLAVTPVLAVTALYGEKGTADLLVFSQVILSMQLPFAVIPLVRFVSDKKLMGSLAISRTTASLAWIAAGLIVALNTKLIWDTIG